MERAVNYCRCSTEEESQRDALKIQTMESREWIQKMGWLHVDEYVEAKSGTQVKGRSEYQRLYDDMLEDKFDIIVIKDQDRLMRNTKDWYLFLDRMQQNGKRLFMYLENKWYKSDDALITGIRAILAEEYSRTLSRKINNAHRGRQEKGTTAVLTGNVCGFKKNGKELEIDDQEARAINRMYELSTEGYGATRISNKLFQEGFTDRNGHPYKDTRIRRILRNPLYKGIVVMNRLHFDFETKQISKNPPEKWIYHKGLVPPIVTEELWTQANQAMDARLEKEQFPASVIQHRHVLSGRIRCGCCGNVYYHTSRRNKSGVIREWKCSAYLRYGRKHTDTLSNTYGCDNIHLEEYILLDVLENIRIKYYAPQEGNSIIVEQMLKLLEKTLGRQNGETEQRNLQQQQERIVRQKDKLLDKLLSDVITDQEYKKKMEELNTNESVIAKRLQDLQKVQISTEQLAKRLEVIRTWMESGGIQKASTMDMMDDIRQITVYPDYLLIDFIPGRMLDLVKNPEAVHIRAEYPFHWTTKRGRELTELRIIESWKKNPRLTVKEMATELQMPYTAVLGRVNHMKQQGRVRYTGKNGRGTWEVLDV